MQKTKMKHLLRGAEIIFFERRLPGAVANSKILCFLSYAKHKLINSLRKNKGVKRTIFFSLCLSGERYLFQILNFFNRYNCNLILFNAFKFNDFLKLKPFGRLIFLIKNLKISKKIPDDTQNYILVYEGKMPEYLKKREWKKIIKINHDISLSASPNKDQMVMPYAMHPKLYVLGEHKKLHIYRSQKRKMRILFSGDVRDAYLNNYVKKTFNKMTRREIIETVLTVLSREELMLIDGKKKRNKLFSESDNQHKSYINKCVILKQKVPFEFWLSTLSKSHFYLCAPGWLLPMCHGAIETMAVGTIPIANCPEWFSPSLKDMENCIVYTDSEELIKKIRYILEMPLSQIEEMKSRVIMYYEQFLSPESFMSRIKIDDSCQTEIFQIAEVERYLSKINDKSIIFKSN